MAGIEIAGLLLGLPGPIDQYLTTAKRLQRRYAALTSNDELISLAIKSYDPLLTQLNVVRRQHQRQRHVLPTGSIQLIEFRIDAMKETLRDATEVLCRLDRRLARGKVRKFMRAESTKLMCEELLRGAAFVQGIIDTIFCAQTVCSVVMNVSDTQTIDITNRMENVMLADFDKRIKAIVESCVAATAGKVFLPRNMQSSAFRATVCQFESGMGIEYRARRLFKLSAFYTSVAKVDAVMDTENIKRCDYIRETNAMEVLVQHHNLDVCHERWMNSSNDITFEQYEQFVRLEENPGGFYVIDIADGLDEQSVRMQLAKIVEQCGGVLESDSIRAETDFYLTVARVLTWFKNWDCIFFIVWRRLRSFTILNGLSNLYRSSKNTILVFCGSLDVRGFHRFATVTQGMPIP